MLTDFKGIQVLEAAALKGLQVQEFYYLKELKEISKEIKKGNQSERTFQSPFHKRACRSGVDRYVRNVKAAGSNPAEST